MIVLETDRVSISYGRVCAVQEVSMVIGGKQIVCVIGANGAGKTTLLKAICGMVPVCSGLIRFEGRNITGLKAHQIVALGISMVPEGRRIFKPLSVLDNLRLGAYVLSGKKEAGIERNFDLIFQTFPVLRERKRQLGATLSGGEQQMLAIARALMSRPKLLLMDEPSLGLAPLIIKEIFRVVAELNRSGTTMVVVEQNARMALQVAHYGYVLEVGRVATEGKPEELVNNEKLKDAYLGEAPIS
jgi:branched-chain amino acid transport system ATP-binding protein